MADGDRIAAPPTPLTLSEVNRRRTELWAISVVLLVTATVAIAVLSSGPLVLPWLLELGGGISWTVVVLISGLGLAFLVYVVEKERNLRRLAVELVDERVRSAALSARLDEAARLSEVGRAISESLDIEVVLDRIVSSALDLLGCDEGAVLLLDDDSRLLLASYKGPAEAPRLRSDAAIGVGYAGRALEERRPLLVENADGRELTVELHEDDSAPSSYMVVPLAFEEALLGALEVCDRGRRRPFTWDELDALGLFGAYASIAVTNARLFEAERATVTRLEELDSLKDEFVAMVSHELRSPLTAIIGAAKTMGRAEIDMKPEQRADFLDMIYRQADKMLHLTEDFLTVARMDSGMPSLKREPIDLRKMAEQVVDDLQHTASGRGRKVQILTRPAHPDVWGDPQTVRQILSNLVENALKYSPLGSPVKVCVLEDGGEAVLEVWDQGNGIPEDQLSTIFERYRQVQGNGGRAIHGVGLGLFIVKRLVDAHNGHIEVESTVGEGSMFRVRLPRRSDR